EELPPEFVGKEATSDRWLQVEAHHWEDRCDRLCVLEQVGNRLLSQRGQAQERCVVSQTRSELRFGDCLCALSANTRDLYYVVQAAFFLGQLQNGLKQSVLPDGELRGVDSDGNASGSGRQVVAGQRALAALIELSLGIQRKRVRRNHQARTKLVSHLHQNFPSRVWKCVGLFSIVPPRRIQSAIQAIISDGVTPGL